MADGFTTTRSVPMPVRWGEKRYHSLDYALKSQFGEKVYRIALNGGMTCPNRDGKIGRGGCIFCSGMGSGDFAGSLSVSANSLLPEKRLFRRNDRFIPILPISRHLQIRMHLSNTWKRFLPRQSLIPMSGYSPLQRVLTVCLMRP